MDGLGPELIRKHGDVDAEHANGVGSRGWVGGKGEELAPYEACVGEIGMRFISEEMGGTAGSGDRKADFLRDHDAFMRETGAANFKIPVLGGSQLDIYNLFVQVMETGGIQRVIDTRAFKTIARGLLLPPTCTSAAYVLKQSYDKILHDYEQKFVFSRNPRLAQVAKERAQLTEENAADAGAAKSEAPAWDSAGIEGAGVSAAEVESNRAPSLYPSRERPKRKAAETASSAVAATAYAAMNDERGPPPPTTRARRGRPPSVEKAAAEAATMPTGTLEDRIREDFANMERPPDALFMYDNPKERERLVLSIACDVREQVAWGLGTMNALSFDPKRICYIRDFPGIIEALLLGLQHHWRDTERWRKEGLHPDAEARLRAGPRLVAAGAVDVQNTGAEAGPGSREPSLQQYDGDLFNARDTVSIELEERAAVASNILRNLSFVERNAQIIAESTNLHEIVGRMVLSPRVGLDIKENLMDMWVNSSVSMNVSETAPAEKVLVAIVGILDPFLPGLDSFTSRFAKSAEIIARLSANVEKNEAAITANLEVLLPRLIDIIVGGKQPKVLTSGLAAVCNISAFDWPARGRLARVPRAIGRLVALLTDPELAPRAALTLLNLVEAPNNRSVLISYEADLVELAVEPGPASETIASVLYEFTAS